MPLTCRPKPSSRRDLCRHHEVEGRGQRGPQCPHHADGAARVGMGRGRGCPEKTFSTSVMPVIASPTPMSVSPLGRILVVAQIHAITRIGAVYSSRIATPTDRCATAL